MRLPDVIYRVHIENFYLIVVVIVTIERYIMFIVVIVVIDCIENIGEQRSPPRSTYLPSYMLLL